MGTLARRIGLSPVPLFLLAGLLLGEGGLADVEATAPFVEATAEIGVPSLLLLGLEFSAAEFTASLKRHAPSGLVDLALNATPGYLAGLLLGLAWPACLALAGITWISSSGIVARLLQDLRRVGNRETPAVLSVLVLEDMAMALYLPVVAVLLTGGTAGRAAVGALLAVGAVLAMLIAAHRFGDQLERALRHDDDEQVLLRVLGLTLLVAGFTHWVGASAAVGAFLVGVAIPGETARRAREVMSPLRDLFAAIFFLSFGLKVAPAEVVPALPAAPRARCGHCGDEGAHRLVRRPPGRGGPPRTAPRRNRPDRPEVSSRSSSPAWQCLRGARSARSPAPTCCSSPSPDPCLPGSRSIPLARSREG